MKQSGYLYFISLAVVLLMCSLWPLQASCQEPVSFGGAGVGSQPHIHFSSTLLNEDGKPVAGFHLLSFHVHDSEDGRGDPLWSETLPAQSDANGHYSVDLMTSAAGVGEVFNDHPLFYVSSSIPGSSSLSGAQVITTIPQAIYQDCNLDGQKLQRSGRVTRPAASLM